MRALGGEEARPPVVRTGGFHETKSRASQLSLVGGGLRGDQRAAGGDPSTGGVDVGYASAGASRDGQIEPVPHARLDGQKGHGVATVFDRESGDDCELISHASGSRSSKTGASGKTPRLRQVLERPPLGLCLMLRNTTTCLARTATTERFA